MKQQMRRVLLVSYAFPPTGGSGVIRPLKFAKYLPEFGWQPTVLTVTKGDSFYLEDKALLNQLSEHVTIERTPSIELFKTTQVKQFADQLEEGQHRSSSFVALKKRLRNLLKAVYFSIFIPDDKIGWIYPAVRRARQLAEKQKFDIIIATSPPQTNLLVATWLKYYLGIPVILDYRDEWSTNPHNPSTNFFSGWINKYLEKQAVKKSDAILLMSNNVLNNLYNAKIITSTTDIIPRVLPNGFDLADFPNVSLRTTEKCFQIVYTGSFYGTMRIPDPFLHALHQWLSEEPQIRHQVRALFQGSIYPKHGRLISRLNLEDVVTVGGQVSHQESVMAQKIASLLLLVMGKAEGTAILPGKVFEYLGAQRPILAIVHPEGEAAKLIQQTNCGLVVDPEEISAIVAALKAFYQQWRTGGIKFLPNKAVVEQYSRKVQVRQLAQLMNTIINSHSWRVD